MNCRQPFLDSKPQLKAGARCRFGHSPRIEFAVCSQGSVLWFALRRVPKEIGSVPILRPMRDRAERTCGGDREAPACPGRFAFADSFTMCHTDFSVMPSPHVLPTLFTRRNSFPPSMAAAFSHSCNSHFTQPGTGTVRTCPSLPPHLIAGLGIKTKESGSVAAEDVALLVPTEKRSLIDDRDRWLDNAGPIHLV